MMVIKLMTIIHMADNYQTPLSAEKYPHLTVVGCYVPDIGLMLYTEHVHQPSQPYHCHFTVKLRNLTKVTVNLLLRWNLKPGGLTLTPIRTSKLTGDLIKDSKFQFLFWGQYKLSLCSTPAR